MGGPSGIVVGAKDLDRKLCSEDLPPGAGALIVFSEDKCIVDIMLNIAQFFKHESCGQCSPCREGTKRILELFERWTSGEGNLDELELLKQMGTTLALTSKCGLGQFAAVAFNSSLPEFEAEFIAHLRDKTCPAGVCVMDRIPAEVA
jgi:NADP-reducing hydrogenase subunit HndC